MKLFNMNVSMREKFKLSKNERTNRNLLQLENFNVGV